jgi:hypothetical protein
VGGAECSDCWLMASVGQRTAAVSRGLATRDLPNAHLQSENLQILRSPVLFVSLTEIIMLMKGEQ